MKRRQLVLAGLSAGVLAALGAGQAGCQSAASAKLRVGLLPIVDSLPLYVAETEGLFKAQSVDVELTLFASAFERDAALQAGQLDLVLNDLVSATLLNKDADRVRVIRLAYRGNPSMPMMIILAAPGSQIKSAADLKGKTVAISGNTVIEYSTDRLLEAAGLAASDVTKTEVTKIPVRAEMLAKGQVSAATLPEPLASLAEQQGAQRILDDGTSGIGLSVITARSDAIQKSSADLKKLLTAYERAVEALAAAPDKYRDLFVDKAKIPDSLRDKLKVPSYPKAQVPTREDVAAVQRWAKTKGLVPAELVYEKMVDASLLPSAGPK